MILKMKSFGVCNTRIFFAKQKQMTQSCKKQTIIINHLVHSPQPTNPPLRNQSMSSHNITYSKGLVRIYIIGINYAGFNVLNV